MQAFDVVLTNTLEHVQEALVSSCPRNKCARHLLHSTFCHVTKTTHENQPAHVVEPFARCLLGTGPSIV